MAAPRLRAGLMPVPVMGMVAKDMGVSGISLGISCREYDIDKDEGSNDLSTKAITLGVAMSHHCKDHTPKSPSNALNTNSVALAFRPRVTHDSQDSDVEEQESGHELCNASPPERP
nr:hypothetical protein CFOL_v3_27320 [Ipomoea batatas]